MAATSTENGVDNTKVDNNAANNADNTPDAAKTDAPGAVAGDASTAGTAGPDAAKNGDTLDSNGGGGDGGVEKPAAAAASDKAPEGGEEARVKTVTGILAKVKNNPTMSETDKVDTLCVLVSNFVEENNMLKAEVSTLHEHIEKSAQANDAVKRLNTAYKEQISLVQEESQLKLKEEEMKRATYIKSYQTTMDELSTLLETHTGHNNRLREENIGMSDKLKILIDDGEKREQQVANRMKEYQLTIELMEHKVMKANIEKAEVKADLTKEKIELVQELEVERQRSSNLEETVSILKDQANMYQSQIDSMEGGAGDSAKKFQRFKQQIDKLTAQLVQLDKDTNQWRDKYEVSSEQVRKMNEQSLKRENEIVALKNNLDQMVKLNKVLANERKTLTEKINQLESASS